MGFREIFWAMVVVLVVGAILIAFGGFMAPANAATTRQTALQLAGGIGNNGAPGGLLAEVKGGVQEIQLFVEGGAYYPNPIRVRKGTPVRITADLSRVPGCSRSVVLPEFGIRKVLSANDNTLEFTPGKSGTFQFSCTMGMYRGTIVVEEPDGTVAAFTGNAPVQAASGGSCGGTGGSGGCGCGG